MEATVKDITEKVKAHNGFVNGLLFEIRKVIVGQKYMLDRLMIGLLADGHILLEGVPGLAKTLSVSTLTKCLHLGYKRIQFTPDLLPADILGYNDLQSKRWQLLNPKKVQYLAILFSQMKLIVHQQRYRLLYLNQCRKDRSRSVIHPIHWIQPFLVLATQNPIEQEGTYRLPEAQVDRFMLKLKVGYPNKKEERDILQQMTSLNQEIPQAVATKEDIFNAKQVVAEIYLDDRIKDYIVDLVYATREPKEHGIASLEDLLDYGASPRATIALAKAAQAHAFLRNRGYVIPEDIKAIGFDVLRHRLSLSFEAEAENVTSEEIIQTLFDKIEVP